jgi:exodeoxyribonuclease VII small subunit
VTKGEAKPSKPSAPEPELRKDSGEAAAEQSRLEDELDRLERIVQRLEREDVSLDDALALFEEGIAIARSARSKLEVAEARVREILRDAGESFRVRDIDM